MRLLKILRRAALALVFVLAGCALLEAQDLKGLIDRTIHEIRSVQNSDGSYGTPERQPDATALVLLALANSPRCYTDTDGPFVRKAAEWLLSKQLEDGSLRAGPHGDRLRSTATAMAALAAINPSHYASFISRAEVFLQRRLAMSEKPLAPETRFFLALALLGAKPGEEQLIAEVAERGESDPLFTEVCLLMAGKEVPGNLGPTMLEEIEKETAGGATPAMTGPSPLRLIAACRLFTLLEKKDSSPKTWAGKLAGIISGILEGSQGSSKNTHVKVEDSALLVSALSLCFSSKEKAPLQGPPPGKPAPLPPQVAKPLPLKQALSASLGFLEKNQKKGVFGFAGIEDPGITAMALSAVIRASRMAGREKPAYVTQGLIYLSSLKKKDGSIFLTGLKTYVTSVSLMAFKDSGDPRYKDIIARARNFLLAIQADEGEGYSMEQDPFYGGMGYGGDERPDLSNTQIAMDALKAAGIDKKHQAFKKALNFLEKCQNLAESNSTRVVLKDGKKVIPGTDGGGIYAPGDSKAGLEKVGDGIYVARSYGSMTYALLKSLLFAGLDPSDKRVKAAVKWIQDHYTLEENPGFKVAATSNAGQQGLFYYYLTMARALKALGKDVIADSAGTPHRWREELARKILSLQRTDGSWINERSPRWFEGNPVLATSYAILVLNVCSG